MKSYKDVKKRLVADPEFRKEYEALGPEFELTNRLSDDRTTRVS